MNSAAKSLYLCVLLGSYYIFASGDLRADDQSATPVVSRLTKKAPSDPRRVVDALRPSLDAVNVKNAQETLPPRVEPEQVSARKSEVVAVPEPKPMTAHKPAVAGSAPLLPGHAFTNKPELNVPPYGFSESGIPIIDGTKCVDLEAVGVNRPDQHFMSINPMGGIELLASVTANRPRQHPAPEAVLRFSRGCTDAEFSNWSLSSLDVPRASVAIPHGPLMLELRIGVEPVQFVELMFDGRPLKPSNDVMGSPLSFSVPCPSPGQHWIQARYLSGNVWSYYSQPIRFEVRLLQKPRIIAASDMDNTPTPLVRNAVPSITTHSIKVYLADIDNGDKVVAYIDGKPLPSTGMPELSQSESGPCCHVFQVQGIVTPGVHKLTVRAVGCPGACSITSEPSNEVLFHYYDESIYLLRPAACYQCDNDQQQNLPNPGPIKRADASRLRLQSPNAWPREATTDTAASKVASEHRLVSLLVDNPATAAAQLLESAQRFRDLASADAAITKMAADATADQYNATVENVGNAEKVRERALALRNQAQQAAQNLDNFEKLIEKFTDDELTPQKTNIQSSIANSKDARVQADRAYQIIHLAAETGLTRANECQVHLEATAKANIAAGEFLRVANEALAKAQIFANDSRHAQDVTGNTVSAEQSRQKTELELKKVQNAQEAITALVAPVHDRKQAATELSRLVAVDLALAQEKLRLVQIGAGTVVQQYNLAKENYEKASKLADHLLNPDYLTVRSATAAARAAHEESISTAQRARNQADYAKVEAVKAKSDAESAKARSADVNNAIERAKAAVRGAIDAAKRADAAVVKAENEVANYPGSSRQYSVAQRSAATARTERDAAYKDVTEASAAYNAALNYSTGVAKAAADAANHATAASGSAADADHHARAAGTVRDAILQARIDAEEAAMKLIDALKKNDNVAVVTARSKQTASAAQIEGERQTRELNSLEAKTSTHAKAAENFARLTRAESDRASQVANASERAELFMHEAIKRANAAEANASQAGLTLELQKQLVSSWENAEVAALQDALRARVENASNSKTDIEVRRAEENARVAEHEATWAESRSAARIREYEAKARTARANNVTSVPSPFYFASTAHFPIREFGLRGETLERDGILIYEDMEFSFDREGNYEVKFRASTPKMPSTVRLQFQIQPHRGGPWYTITLAPIEFPYPTNKNETTSHLASCDGKGSEGCGDDENSKECCGKTHTCACKGHSEILRRCYAEMGKDAKIRRSGTARMGFGIQTDASR